MPSHHLWSSQASDFWGGEAWQSGDWPYFSSSGAMGSAASTPHARQLFLEEAVSLLG